MSSASVFISYHRNTANQNTEKPLYIQQYYIQPSRQALCACRINCCSPVKMFLSSRQAGYSNRQIGMIFLYLYAISQLENYLKKHFTSFILLSIDNSNFIYLFTMRLLFPL